MKSIFCLKTSFQEKVKLFSHEYLECCAYASKNPDNSCIRNRSFYSRLAATSQILNDFLVFHHAINNVHWQLYAEMCSMTREIAMGAYWQKHFARCHITNKIPEEKNLNLKAEKALSFLNSTLIKITTRVIQEAKKLNILVINDTLTPENFPSIDTSDILVCNTLRNSTTTKKGDIVKIVSEFLLLVSNFNKLKLFPNGNIELLKEQVPDKINSAMIKHFEILINNSRAFFDACITEPDIISTSTFSELKELKTYLDSSSYLLQMTASLLRLYEHYLNILDGHCSIHNKKVKKELFSLVPPSHLLSWAAEFGVKYAYILLNLGKNLAIEILDQNIEITSIKVGVPMKFGFHTRPSLLVAKIVQHYGSKVYLEVGSDKFDASSVLNIQWAGGKIQKEKICEVVFSGDTRALRDIELLASINYGEDTMGKGIKIPAPLKYLK